MLSDTLYFEFDLFDKIYFFQFFQSGVQTDCATPALARFGSDQLKRDYLAPALAGDHVSCIGVSEPGEFNSILI